MKFYTLFTLYLAVASGLFLSSALAQSPPAPETTFTQASNTNWINAANWDNGLPSNTVNDAAMDDALIDAGKTSFWDQTVNGDPAFGTLTLGVGSTFQEKVSGNTGLPSGATAYFNDGSLFQLTAGTINRAANYYIVPSAAATIRVGNNDIPQGTLNGSGDLDVITKGSLYLRWTASAYTGNLTYKSDGSSARYVQITQFGTAPIVGPGVTIFADKVRANLETSNRIDDNATLKLIGGTGDSNPKFQLSTDKSDTIKNLIIDSPTSSGPTIQARNGWLKTPGGNVTFQGTAGTVQIDNALWPGSFNAGLDARNADITFGGTGSWTVTGDGQLYLDSSSTITTTNDTTLSCIVRYDSGTVNKYGNGTLTLDVNNFTNLFNASVIIINAGDVVFSAGVGSVPTLTHVSFEALDTSFTAEYDGSFATIAAVEAAIGDTGNFRLGTGVPGALWEQDNEDGTFSVAVGEVIVNRDPTNVLDTTATLRGILQTPDTNYIVYVHWGTTDGTNNQSAWGDSEYVGVWTNVNRTNLTYAATNLVSGTTHYFTFRATNDTTNVWASPSMSFTTIDVPVVNNSTGATSIDANSATLRGELTGGAIASAWICWGTNDAGIESTSDWDNVESIGSVSNGVVFSTDVTGLATNQTYWYRCYATNNLGKGWAEDATTFNGTPVASESWTPEYLDLAAWFDASDTNTITDSGGLVSQWDDKSTNANHVTNGGGDQPETGNRNILGLNVLDFASNDYLDNSADITSQPYSYAIIAGVDNSGENNTLFDANGGQRSLVRHNNSSQLAMYAGAWGPSTAGPSTGNLLVSGTFNGASSEVRYNGGTADTNNPSTGNLTEGITIGNNATPSTDYNHDGVIGEIVITIGSLSTTDRQLLEGYLAHKWGISLVAGHPYEDDPPWASSIANLAPTNITESSLYLNASLSVAAETNYAVYVHFGTSDGGTNFGWESGYYYVGSWTNSSSTSETYTVSYPKSGLAAETAYWYTFRASNDTGNVWASPSWCFTLPELTGYPSVFMFW